MNLVQLAPGPRERAIAIGTTGSGKTELAKAVTTVFRYVVAIDPKQTLGAKGKRGGDCLPGYALALTPTDLDTLGRTHEKIQYRPEIEYENPDDWDRVFEWIYRRGNTHLYIDELFDVHHNRVIPQYLRRCYTSGRELGISILASTQRPRQIDPRVWTESEVYYVFHLRSPDDRRLLRDRIGEGELPPYAFWYSRDVQPFQPPVMKKLELTGREP